MIHEGKKYTPRRATNEEQKIYDKYIELKEEIKDKYEELDALLLGLQASTMILKDKEQKEYEAVRVIDKENNDRTIMLGKPKGHYVQYKELDIVKDAKTIKEDLSA